MDEEGPFPYKLSLRLLLLFHRENSAVFDSALRLLEDLGFSHITVILDCYACVIMPIT